LSSAPMTGISEEEDDTHGKATGLINSDNAWCWREGCEGERIAYDISRSAFS